jgi:hypothetical protein
VTVAGGSGATLHNDGARPAATVFVSDPTAEAERVAQALRGAGYLVVDVPQTMLVARVAVQHPRVVLVDADSEGALEVVARMRELPDADDIHVLFVARPGGTIPTPEEALAHEGSGLFVRPVDIPAMVRKVEALTAGTPHGDAFGDPQLAAVPAVTRKRSSSPPSGGVGTSPGRGPGFGSNPSDPGSALVLRSPGGRSSRAPSDGPGSGPPGSRKVVGLAPPLSPELQQLLVEAEQRVHVHGDHESVVPSPEDEIEAVLPAELLDSLDAPIEEDGEEDELALPGRTAPPPAARTGDGLGRRTTGSTTGNETSRPRGTTADRSRPREGSITPGPPHTHGGTHAGPTGSGVGSTTGNSAVDERASAAPAQPRPLPPPSAEPGPPEPAPVLFPPVLAEGDAVRVIARAVASRTTGTLCLASPEAQLRIVLREGDVVTLASSGDDESLLSFLGVRGDLPRETVRRLGAKFPPFGRHAGAALVARGYLRQDQMWPTLRAHAEWLFARALQTSEARLTVEPLPPGRLAGEPSVFGGSTGAEVFVEVVRRILPPADAVERLGGLGSRVGDGPEIRLLAECALAPQDVEQIRASAGRALREILQDAPEGDLATVLFALAQLGVVEVLPALAEGGMRPEAASAADVAALDAEAIRERVRARMQLVEDGDYFAVLGVTPAATGYEVRRAFLELRRAFDPARMLAPEVADLADDVRKITSVLEEAYEILKDAARRERYRRAIEAVPGR